MKESLVKVGRRAAETARHNPVKLAVAVVLASAGIAAAGEPPPLELEWPVELSQVTDAMLTGAGSLYTLVIPLTLVCALIWKAVRRTKRAI